MTYREITKDDRANIIQTLLQAAPAVDQAKAQDLVSLLVDFNEMRKTPLELRDAIASDKTLFDLSGQLNLGTQNLALGNQLNVPITIKYVGGEPEEVVTTEPEPPCIYISHCASEPQAAALLRALEEQLPKAGFRLWMDEWRLTKDATWRYELFDRMGRCKGAIILFSPAALKSGLVADEARILLSRANDHMFNFVLFKLLTDGVTEEQVAKSLLGGRGWSEIATVPNENVTVQGGALADAFRKKGTLDEEGPLEVLERRVSEALAGVSRQDLKRATQRLDLTLPTALSASDLSKQLGRVLLKAEPAQTAPALTILHGSGKVDPSDFLFLMTLGESSWVDPRSAAWIPFVTLNDEGQRVLRLNAVQTDTGRYCIARACTLRPDYLRPETSWRVAETVAHKWDLTKTNRIAGLLRATCKVINDELDRRALLPWTATANPGNTVDEELVVEINEQLVTLVKVDKPLINKLAPVIQDVAIVRRRLADLEHDNEPFILLVAGRIDSQDLNVLRAGFPMVTYLLLAGEQELSIEHLAIMCPPLPKGR